MQCVCFFFPATDGMANGVRLLCILVGTIEVCAIHFAHGRRIGLGCLFGFKKCDKICIV